MKRQKLIPTPSARTVRSFRFPALNGGLNLRDEEINLKDNESPEIVNLWWDEGILQSRPGREESASGWGVGAEETNEAFPDNVSAYALAEFQEGVVAHIGASLYTWHGDWRELRRVPGEASESVPENAGTFFYFGDDFFYKNEGGFFRLAYDPTHTSTESPFEIVSVTDEAFTPTILINADPATGSGDAYQPENCLSPQKRVTYNASATPETVILTGDGAMRGFNLNVNAYDNLRGVKSVYINDAFMESALYEVDLNSGVVIFNAAPPADSTITVTLNMGKAQYHLPVESVDAVVSVKVDGLEMTEGSDYTVDLVAGVVTFTESPPITDPPTNNTVAIIYSKANRKAMKAVMSCPYAAVCGSGTQLCIVVGGGSAQPNAIYWSGNTEYGFDPTYFPVTNSNLARDDITGFANQYGETVVFQKRRVGKLSVEMESVNGRDTISLTYAGVNDKIGCDLPRSIQLIENNLTFANTKGGVYQILSSSAAYENNIRCVSEKINGSDVRPGLLYDMRVTGAGRYNSRTAETNAACSLDDGKRYWLAVNGHIWLWDYSISQSADPVWFYFSDVPARALSTRDGVPCLLDEENRMIRLAGEVFSDFGDAPIRKVYQFPARNFGRYDYLKDVLSVLFTCRDDVPSDTTVIYETDYETRTDPVRLTVAGYDRLGERNLEERDLSVRRRAAAFRRDPRCLNVRRFAMRLENNTAGNDLNVNFVEIQIRYSERER